MLPTSTPSVDFAAPLVGATTRTAPCASARALSLRQFVVRLGEARKVADETNSALLVWLLSGPGMQQREGFLGSLPARLLSGDVHWLPIQHDQLAVVVTNLDQDDLESVSELITGALPEDVLSAAFAYPTDWYRLDNEPEGTFKPHVALGPGYLSRCVADAEIRRAGLSLSGKPFLCLEPAFFRPTPFWKRTIDIAATAAALIALAPLFLLIAAIIKLRSRGPLFFWQARHGGAGRKFQICKFRTMKVDFDTTKHSDHLHSLLESGKPMEKLDVPQALIPHAKWIRSMGIDELPQLWNVLRGEMSLVGPRPDVIAMDHYSNLQRRRFDVVPGLTGLWQISGKNRTTFEQMMAYDIQYIESRSLLNDIKIVLKTIPAVIRVAVD